MRKIVVSAVTTALSITLLLGSLVTYNLNKNKAEKEYENAVMVAEQSGRLEDDDTAISMFPSRIKPYLGYIDAIKVDGEFSSKEEQSILNHINPNLSKIKEEEGYGQLAFELGRLYWFYYGSSSDNVGKVQSARWFKDAIASGYNTEMSTVYYNLGSFHRDIATSIREADDAGMYSEYWNNLIAAKDVNAGDIVSLQTNIALAECISNYAYNLKRDSISYEDLIEEVDSLKFFLSSFNVSESSVEVVQELYAYLEGVVSGLQDRVDLIYKNRGDA